MQWLFGLFSLWIAYTAHAQQPSLQFQRYSTEDGLQGLNVRAILQDRLGFIWVGTNNGLYRYNAYEFEGFFHNPNQADEGLSDNTVLSLHEDPQGFIWVGTNNGGINRFDPESQTFQSWTTHNSRLSDNTIYSIDSDQKGGVWLGTKQGGLCHLNPQTEEITIWKKGDEHPAMPSNYVWEVKQGQDRLWVGTSFGLLSMGQDSTLKHHPCPFEKEGLEISGMALQGDSTLWVTAWQQGLYKFDRRQGKYLEHYEPGQTKEQRSLSNVHVSKQQKGLWISTYGGGVFHWEFEDGGIEHAQLFQYQGEGQSTPSNTVWTILEDQVGDVWVGSISGLLYGSFRAKKGFHTYTALSKDLPLPSSLVWSTAADIYGNFWIGTSAGLVMMPQGQAQEYQQLNAKERGLPNNRIKAMLVDSQGDHWIGFWGGGLARYRYHPEEGWQQTSHWKGSGKEDGLVSPLVLSLAEDPHTGNIWVGTLRGASCYQRESQRFVSYTTQNSGLTDNYIYSAAVTSNQAIWLGTAKGLHFLENGKGKWKVLNTDNSSLLHNKINCLKEDNQGRLWIGTDGGGLSLFHPKESSWKNYLASDGLSGNSIKAIEFTLDGRACITTEKGITLFEEEAKRFDNYTREDGVQAGAFSASSSAISPEGYLLLGGEEGLTYFHPDSLSMNKELPPVHFTKLKVFGQERSLPKALPYQNRLDLSYEDKVLEFDFTALNYLDAESNQFAYMLEGFDEDWRVTSSERRFATYTNLPAGKEYTLKVKASNNDGQWNEQGTALMLYLKPPLWETTLFKITLAFVGIVLTLGIYRWRVASIERSKKSLKEQVERRTQEIQEKNAELEQRNVELHQQQEEILSQRDYIEKKNQQLESQQLELRQTYQNISTLTGIGREITSHLQLDDLVRSLYTQVNMLMDASGFGIGIWTEDKPKVILFEGYMENGEMLPEHTSEYNPEKDLSSWCLSHQEAIFINDIEKEYTKYLGKSQLEAVEGELPQSIIYVPIKLEGKKKGVATVQSFKKNAYSEKDLRLLESLASYLAIALVNINNYESVERARDAVKRKNLNIIDSLRYAETIQRSILPFEEELAECFAEHFILYRPKDIVSGDFYWLAQEGDYTFWAVADCTGHGVPGAFMSLIGNDSLDRLIQNDKKTSPSAILESLHALVYDILQQDLEMNKDGMDIGICRLKKQENGNTEVVFSGAKRPFVWAEAGKLREIKGTRRSIGGFGQQKVDILPFEEHRLVLPPNTPIYLSTDGFVDQHNAKRKKFGSRALRMLVSEIHSLPMEKQREKLVQALEAHQGDMAQRDDITMTGVRLS